MTTDGVVSARRGLVLPPLRHDRQLQGFHAHGGTTAFRPAPWSIRSRLSMISRGSRGRARSHVRRSDRSSSRSRFSIRRSKNVLNTRQKRDRLLAGSYLDCPQILRESAMNDVINGFECGAGRLKARTGRGELRQIPERVRRRPSVRHRSNSRFRSISTSRRFRGGDWSDRAEVSFEVPAKDLRIRAGGTADSAARRRAPRPRERRRACERVASRKDRITSGLPETRLAPARCFPGQIVLCPRARALRRRHRGVRQELEPESRVQDKASIFPPTRGSPVDQRHSVREQHRRRPRRTGDSSRATCRSCPIRSARTGFRFPLIFYFEIYGLDTDDEGIAFYRVEYRIVPLEKTAMGAGARRDADDDQLVLRDERLRLDAAAAALDRDGRALGGAVQAGRDGHRPPDASGRRRSRRTSRYSNEAPAGGA